MIYNFFTRNVIVSKHDVSPETLTLSHL